MHILQSFLLRPIRFPGLFAMLLAVYILFHRSTKVCITIPKKVVDAGALWPVDREHGPLLFQKFQIFGGFSVSSENFRTFAFGKDKSFEFYRKIFELGPLLYRYYEASE